MMNLIQTDVRALCSLEARIIGPSSTVFALEYFLGWANANKKWILFSTAAVKYSEGDHLVANSDGVSRLERECRIYRGLHAPRG